MDLSRYTTPELLALIQHTEDAMRFLSAPLQRRFLADIKAALVAEARRRLDEARAP